MAQLKTKFALSRNRQGLIEIMQRLNFGRIEHLSIQKSEPVLLPPPRVIRDIKLGSDSGPRSEVALEDFALREQVIDLFRHLDQIGTGEIEVLEVRAGLPFRIQVRH